MKRLAALRILAGNLKRDFMRHDCALHAAALTYFSLLALVPILCLLLLLARMLGAEEYARHQFDVRLEAIVSQIENGQDTSPLAAHQTEEERAAKRKAARVFGQEARETAHHLFDQARQFDVSALGWIGFGMLFWTAISMLVRVEKSFNAIWCATCARPFWKRCVIYAFVSVVLPVIATIAVSLPIVETLTRGVMSVMPIYGMRAFVMIAATCGFALLYGLMPHVHVSCRNALAAGFVTTLAFGGWIKICAWAQVGIANSSALYGSFAFLPIVLAWFYIGWQIVLAGAVFSHALQNSQMVVDGNPR